MQVNIRKAENKDVNRIVELLSIIANEHQEGRPDLFKRNTKKYSSSELRDILRDGERTVFVGTNENDYIIGYCFCYIVEYKKHSLFKDFDTLYIDDICVDETLRGNGVGKSIFNYCKEYAKSAGCYNIELNVWSFNERAIAFYRSLGMSPQSMKMELVLKE